MVVIAKKIPAAHLRRFSIGIIRPKFGFSPRAELGDSLRGIPFALYFSRNLLSLANSHLNHALR